MPYYFYECRGCGKGWEKFNVIANRKNGGNCGVCGGRGKKTITSFANHTFRKRWFEGIASQPVFVESQSQLDRICKKSGCHLVKDDRKKQKMYYESRGMVAEGKRLCKRGG